MITMAHIQVTRRELLHDDANDYRQSFFRQRVTCDIQVPPITHTRISCFPEELLEAGHIFLPKIPFDRSCDENSHQLKGLRFTILVHTEYQVFPWKLQCFCHGFRRKTRSTFSIGVWFATNKSVDPASAITHAIKTQKNSGRPHVVHGGLAQFTCLRCVCDIICTQLKQLPNRRRTRNGQELNPYRGREAKAARNGLPYSYR